MRNILFLLGLSFLLSNCKPDNIDTIVSIDVGLIYKNSLGLDLLDTAVQNHFNAKDIHVYDLQMGKKVERFYGNFTNPQMWDIHWDSSTYILSVGIETDSTLIQLNKNIVDTLVCTISKRTGYNAVTSVKYNGVLEWNSNSKPRIVSIIK